MKFDDVETIQIGKLIEAGQYELAVKALDRRYLSRERITRFTVTAGIISSLLVAVGAIVRRAWGL